MVLTESATQNEAAAGRGGAGAVMEYEDREAAATAARRYTEADGMAVRLQAPAPNDPRDVDAYLVANPERRVRDPSGSLEDGLSFETGATQYGALGEALVCSHEQDPPVLQAWAERALDVEGVPAVQLQPDIEPVTFRNAENGETATWEPDCGARVTVGGAVQRELRCEIKAGKASTERDQRRVMRLAAREWTVLLLRLDLDGLPDEYGARIEEIEATEPDGDWQREESDRRLAEFH